MINLLPPDKKQSIAFARRNTTLIGWLTSVLISFGLVIVIIVLGFMYTSQAIKSYNEQIAETQETLKVQKLEETQKRVEEISSSLKLVVQVLGKEVMFSKLLQQIGAAMPPDTILTSLSINQLQGGLDLQASATNYQTASQVQVNLKDPSNKIFSNADLVGIQCGTSAGTSTTSTTETRANSKYPCSVTIRVQFSPDSPFSVMNGVKK